MKFDIIDFGDKKSKELAEIISNNTSKKILDYLKSKEATQSEISKDLAIPLSTLDYHISKLLTHDLIEKNGHYWSPKGNKVYSYRATNKVLVFSQKRTKEIETKLRMILPIILGFIFLVVGFIYINSNLDNDNSGIQRFESGDDLIKALKDYKGNSGGFYRGLGGMMMEAASVDSSSGKSSSEYSQTNVQVEGVDEADIVKTDGEFIYYVKENKLYIVKAYPAEDSEIISIIDMNNSNIREIFLNENKVMIFSNKYEYSSYEGDMLYKTAMPYYGSSNFLQVSLYDVEDKENPELLRELQFDGNYVSSRMIGNDVYLAFNSYPEYDRDEPILCEQVVPEYKDSEGNNELQPLVSCADVGYFEPINARGFVSLVGISISDKDKEISKEVIVGNVENVYASENNMYVVQSVYDYGLGELAQNNVQKTMISKFNLDNGKVKFISSGEVKGIVLNQFSMDEFDGHFRIATTVSGYFDNKDTSYSNMFVLDEDLKVVGILENIAPGESIYSVRFMGKRAYMVTFRHIDPLFVIDLSDVNHPNILGKLKIPGYSDYLHPYDETHLIGIGKEVDASIDADLVHTEGAVYYTAIQGVKISIFDVSDVENPIEMHKVVIGDRGTESLATSEHKAFLFDKEKNLLVIPINVAELKEGQDKSEQGDYVFSGAYVYNIDLENGFDLKGKISHLDNNDELDKSGYYYYGTSSILRSLYIENVLYTLSNSKIKMNSLDDLEEINQIKL
jgi:inhibitor of cysteine peptidase